MNLKPEILTQHVIPKALHGVNIRNYWGKSSARWKKLGKETREKQGNQCMACGREVPHKAGDWLELHEEFSYDYENRVAVIDSMVCLCGKCHSYIHQGNLKMRMCEGKVSRVYVDDVIKHGDAILANHGLEKQGLSMEFFGANGWKLMYEGQDLVELIDKKNGK